HQTGPECGHPVAIQVLVEVVAGGIILEPAAAAVPEVLVTGELLTGGQLGRRRRRRASVEAGRAHRSEPGRDAEEVAPAHAGCGQPRGQQVHVGIGDRGTLHEVLLLVATSFLDPERRASRRRRIWRPAWLPQRRTTGTSTSASRSR